MLLFTFFYSDEGIFKEWRFNLRTAFRLRTITGSQSYKVSTQENPHAARSPITNTLPWALIS